MHSLCADVLPHILYIECGVADMTSPGQSEEYTQTPHFCAYTHTRILIPQAHQ